MATLVGVPVMSLQEVVVGLFTWCFRNNRLEMPTLLVESPLSQAPQAFAPAPVASAVDVQQATLCSPVASRNKSISHLMRCVWAMARGRLFGHHAGCGCVLASRYLSEPEVDSWGVLAMILSVTHVWMKGNSVDSQQTLATLTGIVSVCLKYACGEEMRSIKYRGVEVGVEIQILGVLSGKKLLEWMETVYLHTQYLQTVLDAEVMAILRSVPLFCHYADNAQARAERILFELHQSSDQPEDFNTHAFYKSLRALPTFFFACVYDDLFLLQLPERHAPAIAFAILASGDYMSTVATQPGMIVADSREVLSAVLRSAPELPMANVFYTGGVSPRDEWATRYRVQRALCLLSP